MAPLTEKAGGLQANQRTRSRQVFRSPSARPLSQQSELMLDNTPHITGDPTQ